MPDKIVISGRSDLRSTNEPDERYMISSIQPHSAKLKVFISYSRKDRDFADELESGLEHADFEVLIDRHAITGGDEWQRRLHDLILASDTIVFLLSPDSAKSEMCEWEVAKAEELAKRIVPVICREVDFSADLPVRLKELNAIPMSAGHMISGLTKLIDALNADLVWLKGHTRYMQLAEDWRIAKKTEDRLLRGTALKDAQIWFETKPANVPPPSSLMHQFLEDSDAVEIDRVRRDELFEELVTERAAREKAQQTALEEQQAKEKALEAVVKAQQAKEKALEAEAVATGRVVRRTMMALVATTLLAVMAGAAGYFAYIQKRQAVQQSMIARVEAGRALEQSKRAANEAGRLKTLVSLTSGSEAGRRSMNNTCLDAIRVTSSLATTKDKGEQARLLKQFGELYVGPMYIVETHQWSTTGKQFSAIEASMVQFNQQLEDNEKDGIGLPQKATLCPLAELVLKECVDHLKGLKNEAPWPCK